MNNEKDMILSSGASQKPDYKIEITNIIMGNFSPKAMREKLSDYHENDIAEVMTEINTADRKRLFRVLDTAELSNIFEYIPEDKAGMFLDEMDIRKAVEVVSCLESDSAVDILRAIPKERRIQLIDLLDAEAKHKIELIASFDEDEIGSRMTANFIVIKNNMTIKNAMSELIAQAKEMIIYPLSL